MGDGRLTAPPPAPIHEGEVALRLGRRVEVAVRVRIGSGGLLAIGAMTAMMLLGSAAIVRAARR